MRSDEVARASSLVLWPVLCGDFWSCAPYSIVEPWRELMQDLNPHSELA
jgi:hypothetical protein